MTCSDFLSTKSTVSTDRKQIQRDYARGGRSLGELGERGGAQAHLFRTLRSRGYHVVASPTRNLNQGYSTAPAQMLSETKPSSVSVIAGLIVDFLVVRMTFYGQSVVIERSGRPVNPTSELVFSQSVVDFQIEKSPSRSYPTDNGAEALRSLAIVYQVLVRRNVVHGLLLDPQYTGRSEDFGTRPLRLSDWRSNCTKAKASAARCMMLLADSGNSPSRSRRDASLTVSSPGICEEE